MKPGHVHSHPTELEVPESLDASGVPCADAGRAASRATSARRRQRGTLPGLPSTAVVSSMEEVASRNALDWLVWGCVGGRPVLFAVDPRSAAEMLGSMGAGETATAIVEPWQVVLEPLD